MFQSIILPLDLEESGDRPLCFVRRLASIASLPVELVTVSSPGIESSRDQFELERRARLLPHLENRTTLLHSDDAALAIAEHLASRPHALVAMASSARGLVGAKIIGSVSDAVLASQVAPILLFGPRCRVHTTQEPPTLLVAIDETDASEAVLQAAGEWSSTFGGPVPQLIEITDRDRLDDGRELHAARIARRLDQRWPGITAQVLEGRPAEALVNYGHQLDDVVVAMASGRWTDQEHAHLRSTARAVTHRSRFPVLVVPRVYADV